MLFKRASQCCTPVTVKGPGLFRSCFLHRSVHFSLIRHILFSNVYVPASNIIQNYSLFFFRFGAWCVFVRIVSCFNCKTELVTSTADRDDFMMRPYFSFKLQQTA